MSETGSKMTFGSFVATNATITKRDFGFVPDRLELINAGNGAKFIWTKAMGEGTGFKELTGSDTSSFLSSGGISTVAYDASTNGPAGLSIPAIADINDTTTEVIYWTAWKQ